MPVTDPGDMLWERANCKVSERKAKSRKKSSNLSCVVLQQVNSLGRLLDAIRRHHRRVHCILRRLIRWRRLWVNGCAEPAPSVRSVGLKREEKHKR